MRHVAIQAVELADVTRAALVIDDAGGHEQRGLEGGVVDDVQQARDGGHLAVEAEQQRDQAQVTDGREGQHALEVLLHQREPGAIQQGGKTGQTDDVEPQVCPREHRVHARQQEDTGLDHGGGVQEGGYRRRCRHRVGQPELERELGRLGEGAQQHQYQRDRIELVGADLVRRGQHVIELVAADDMPDDQDTCQQCQTPGAGDGQGHAGALARLAQLVPVTDQQEGAQAGQLPEHPHQQQVVCHHDAEHRGHEQHQEAVEACQRILARQVIAGIEDDQQANAENQQHEQPRQTIEAQRQVESQLRDPGQMELGHHAREDVSEVEDGDTEC